MTDTERTQLVRGLGLVAAASIMVGNVIGQGIFLKARVMTCNVDTPGLVLAAWAAAGLLSLAGALTYAELTAMMPRAGGEYVYVREAYGRRPGFLYGWMQVFVAKTGSQAALSVGFAIFLNALLAGALSGPVFTAEIAGLALAPSGLQVVSVSVLVFVSLVNVLSVAMGGRIAFALTVIKISLVLVVGVGAFLLASGDWHHFTGSAAGASCSDVPAGVRGGLAGFGAAMLGALWAYDGWNTLALVAGEVKNPQRNLPLALIAGMTTVLALYLFANVAYFYVLSPEAIAALPPSASVATEVASRFLGPATAALMAAGLLASTFGTLHTSVLSGARVPYAMAADGLLPGALDRTSARTHVPVRALVLQGVWATMLTLSGTYDTLTDYVVFGSFIFYGLTAASVFIFRKRYPDMPRPYRTWGYPYVPILFLLATSALLISTLIAAPTRSMLGLGLIALGLPVYALLERRRSSTS